MEFEEEVSFECPHCGETISMLVEALYGGQSYIEDCQVCCKPIKISYEAEDGKVVQLNIECD